MDYVFLLENEEGYYFSFGYLDPALIKTINSPIDPVPLDDFDMIVNIGTKFNDYCDDHHLSNNQKIELFYQLKNHNWDLTVFDEPHNHESLLTP
jgi:hypothetical protein